ncbi:MAG: cation:dicarboxylate symporter family transporter [Gammaproteobacteria bacterium]
MKKLGKFALPLQILGMFFACALIGNHVSLEIKMVFYAISKSIRVLLNITMPLIIFSCLFNSILDLRGKALSFVFLIFALVSLSNFVSTMTGYAIGSWGLNHVFNNTIGTGNLSSNQLAPLWDLEELHVGSYTITWLKSFPLQNAHGMIAALVLGFIACLYPSNSFHRIAASGNRFVTWFLSKVFVKTLPLFALGFIMAMEHEGVLAKVMDTYFPLFLMIVSTEAAYALFFILSANNFDLKMAWQFFRSIGPAALIGFSTMSSLAALPTTIKALKEHAKDKQSVDLILPATVNIHMVGSSIVIPFLAIYTIASFGGPAPSMQNYMQFALWFVLYKFTVAAVPGGSIYAMLPILKAVLDFDDDMASMVVSMYLLFNPFVAASNVLTNSAFSLILSKIFQRWFTKPVVAT